MNKGREVGKQSMCSRNKGLSRLPRIWSVYPNVETGLLKEVS